MSKRKKKTIGLVLALVALLVVAVVLGIVTLNAAVSPVSKEENKQTITIEDNWYGKTVLNYLDEQGIIKDSTIDYYYAKLKGISLDFKAGKYEVDSSWDFKTIVDYLSNGNNAIQDTVTIKFMEGNRAKDYASQIAEVTSLTYDEVMNYWNDETSIRNLMSDYPFLTDNMFDSDVKCLLEGYLFPDTYEFFYDTTVEELTRKMLDETLVIYNKYLDLFNSSDYTVHEIFTLASIVQRESGNSEDMAKVASVFYNRLKDGMQLQSSVTVCYAIDVGLNDDWTKCEITQTEEDPYNTYQIMGFPPGAICNPGEAAIYAVLNPEDTNYYFFIGDVCGGGSTIFAETYAEQLANQQEYLSCY